MPHTILFKRFWSRVEKDGPIPEHRPDLGKCWSWNGYKKRNGYGTLHVGGRAGGAKYVHRLSWAMEYGKIPEGLCVLHRCDNRCCVRPAHLFLGTCQDNTRDMVTKGRHHPKLAIEDVRLIRLAYETLAVSQQQIADTWGINQVAVGKIIRRERWAHVV